MHSKYFEPVVSMAFFCVALALLGSCGCRRKPAVSSEEPPARKTTDEKDYVSIAAKEIERELKTQGEGQFEVSVKGISQNKPAEVIFDAVITCKLAWQRTDTGFQLTNDDTPGEPIELVSGGKPIGAANLDGHDLTQVSLLGHSVRQTDEAGEVVFEGNQGLLDFIGWPNGMEIGSSSSDSGFLVVRSPQYRMKWQKSSDELEEGFFWELVSAERVSESGEK